MLGQSLCKSDTYFFKEMSKGQYSVKVYANVTPIFFKEMSKGQYSVKVI